MSIESELQALAAPIAGENPCGASLEDTQLLASFDGYRLFGQSIAIPETDWRALKDAALEALAQSKDLRLLTNYSAAVLRTDGWSGFLGSLHVAAGWMKEYFAQTYPVTEEDGILRKNALSCFADRFAIVDGIRRTPIIENKQLGRFALRDVELATGKLTPTETDTAVPTESEVTAALTASPLEDLQKLEAQFAQAIADLQAIDAAMRDFGGAAASPDFNPLQDSLGTVRKLLRDQLDARGGESGESAGDGAGVEGEGGGGGGGKGVGGIKSRQDAIRAIDIVAAYFRQNEPSSPVPLFLDRAKNLIGKSFMDILQDVAPEGVATAKQVGGIKDDQG